MSITITTYKGRDNITGLRLSVSGQTVDVSQLSKIEFIGKDLTVSTDSSPGIFELTETEIRARFGLGDFPVGRQLLRVVGYDAINADGIVFGDIILTVIKGV